MICWEMTSKSLLAFRDARDWRIRLIKPENRGTKLELQLKKKLTLVQTTEGSMMKPKTIDYRSRGQQGWSHYDSCNKTHDGVCCSGGRGCFKCGQMGHISRDCTRRSFICFHCNQVGQKRAACLIHTRGTEKTPSLSSLRIIDGRQGNADAPTVKSRYF